ncbi:sulfite exporter TauE/SafE family protein [Arvimicrobium flavum]|uniref:sulfite exporter TauE/SafE family protein n=1 Tax=Arvimicrobium flavum TaxID=3393320 RepID=UPI00237B7588|nr:sulfite exporter TauE/SafE family protein [Mesorhizobium shangrilense]
MEFSLDAQAHVILGVAALLAGLAKGLAGFGSALVFMPLASAAVGPVVAGPIFIVIDCITSFPLARISWAFADRAAVARIGLVAGIGLPVGIGILVSVDQTMIRWMISLFCLASVFVLMLGLRVDGRLQRASTFVTGLLSGIFHGIAQIGGPPVLLLWIAQGHAKATIRANALLYFALLTIATFIIFVAIGIFSWTSFTYALILLPIYAGGLVAGGWLFGRTSDRWFRAASYALIVGAAIAGLPVLDGLLGD